MGDCGGIGCDLACDLERVLSFTPTPEQSCALDAIGAWLKARDKPWFFLTGAAGTGKTSLARHIAVSWNGPTVAIAYSGKAASVLTSKGLPATTLHSRVYLPTTERNEEAKQLEADLEGCSDSAKERRIRKRLAELYAPTFVKRRDPFLPNTLIICDEVSMIAADEANDLLSFGHPVLVLGDNNQLPPIAGRGFFHDPDFTLTEIHRQARESPIIRLAMLALEGNALPYGSHGTSRVLRRSQIGEAEALGVEQIITGSNKARIELNGDVRKLKGFDGSEFPRAGERLICLRNNAREDLLNGMIFETETDADEGLWDVKLHLAGRAEPVKTHRDCFTRPEVLKSWDYKRRARANEFDFAAALTAHKTQGSQFFSTLVYVDSFRWDRDLFKRWLYTAITRAEEFTYVAL